MNKKRGQVTLFIIIAIVVVAAGLAGWLVYQQQIKKEKISETELANIKGYMQEAINYQVGGALILVGLQGGFSEAPKKHLPLQYHFVPYYYYSKKEAVPSNEELKQEIKKEIAKRIDVIAFNFTELEIEKAQPEIKINSLIEINLPITVKKGRTSITLPIKYAYNNLPIDVMLNISKEIVRNVKADPKAINLEVLFNLQQKYNLIISPLIYDETTTIYRIMANQTMVLNSPFEFYFAVENV